MAIHVFIPTLQGLSHVQSIIKEDPDVPSVICLNGTAQSLPISNAYYDFVKKGQGVIAKDFGHGAWRIDLSDPVEMGTSWQLGIYLTHYFQSKNLLASGEPKAGDIVIWATGAVKVNLDIEAVDGVDRKLVQSEKLFKHFQADQIQTFVVMCEANHALVKLPEFVHRVSLSSCGDLKPLLSALEVHSGLIVNPFQENTSDFQVQTIAAKADKAKLESAGQKSLPYALVCLFVLTVIIATFFVFSVLKVDQNVNQNIALNDAIQEQTAPGDTQHFLSLEKDKFIDKPAATDDTHLVENDHDKLVLDPKSPFLIEKVKSLNQTCDQTQERYLKPSDSTLFITHGLIHLCELSVHFGDKVISSAYLYALDAEMFLPLVKSQHHWTIPLPKNRNKTRKALLFGFENPVTAKEIEKLNRYLAINIENQEISAMELQLRLGSIGYHGLDVYALTLAQF